ncbi:MAG: MlaD family protein [Pseudomonadota bacterium]
METRANFALIGALVLASVVAFASFTLWFGQAQFNRDFDIYEIIFKGPVTLEPGASVRFNGINVGEVTNVSIDRSDDSLVRARIRVDSETPVRTDSVAEIDFAGITGLTFVQILAGSEGTPLLKRGAGEDIPVIQSELDPLSEFFAGGVQILEATNNSLEQISKVLSDENVETLSSTLTNIDTFSGTIADEEGLTLELSQTLTSIREASNAFAEASTSVARLSDDLDQIVVSVSDDADILAEDLKTVVASVKSMLERADSTIGSVDAAVTGPATEALTEFRLAGQEMRLLMQRMEGIVRDLEQNPQSLVAGDPRPYEGSSRP